jgi:methylmalonyl-CoA mutase C-terminal domain/subunit
VSTTTTPVTGSVAEGPGPGDRTGDDIVVAKPGLDGHDRGAKVVARALRDAGMEVIYTGLHQTPEQIVETAIQEDADAVGLSVLSGAHMTLFRRVLELLSEREARDIVVFGGGIIPDSDLPELERLGVAKIFTPGATTTEIVDAFPGMTRHAVMKHIDVLRDVDLINTREEGRRRINSLNVVPIRQIYERWVGPFAELWSSTLLRIKDDVEIKNKE